MSLAELSFKAKATKYEWTYSVGGGQLPVRLSGYKALQVLPIGAGATRQSPFPRGWLYDGSYEGGLRWAVRRSPR